jgi:excisionase family DNA binding protein
MPGASISKPRLVLSVQREETRRRSSVSSEFSPGGRDSPLVPSDTHRAFSVDEVARRLGVHRLTVRTAIDRGDLRAVRLGRRLLVPCSALDAFLAGQAQSGEVDR